MKASISRDRMHLGSHVVLIFWTFLVLFPLWTMIVNSFKFKFDIYTDPFGLPKKWNFESYVSVITDGDFFLYFRNSLFAYAVKVNRNKRRNNSSFEIIFCFFIVIKTYNFGHSRFILTQDRLCGKNGVIGRKAEY